MIVRDEAHVISRCLNSVKQHIDCYAIVDTGSSDGTQNIIRECLKDIPGEVIDRPWIDFSTNRNQALDLARNLSQDKDAFILTIDADDVLGNPGRVFSEWRKEKNKKNCYELRIQYSGLSYWRPHLFRATAFYRYEGVLHEALMPYTHAENGQLDVPYIVMGGGARSALEEKEKFKRDVATLTEALKKEPNHARYQFYLAQSYRDAGEPEKARLAYEKRVTMGGWPEEVWYSLYQIARITGKSDDFLAAYEVRPSRAEPLVEVALTERLEGRFATAYIFAHAAMLMPKPKEDMLFVDDATYTWRALDECAISGYYLGKRKESAAINRKLLHVAPAEHHERIRKNLKLCLGEKT